MAATMQLQLPTRTRREQISEFLSQKRLAVVGVSRYTKDFTRVLFRELLSRGYDVIPVNPAVNKVEGRKCYPDLRSIQPSVSAVLLMTTPEVTQHIVQDCLRVDVAHIWMYRATGRGAVDDPSVELCRAHGINVIAGECPFMFLPGTGFMHRVHGFVRKIRGAYPD